MSHLAAGDRVLSIERCDLCVVDEPWPFAVRERAAIASNWQRRQAQNPAMFNGRIYIMLRHHIARGTLHGAFAATDFASYVFWRDSGHADASVRDGFGSAILRSSERHVLLGHAGAHTLNAGRCYLPGGFIDARDVRGDGTIDIDASIARELTEETGIGWDELDRRPGYWLSMCGPLVSIAVELKIDQPAVALRQRILHHAAREAHPELADVSIVASANAAADPKIMLYSRQLVVHLLDGDPPPHR